ncbi:metallophosphoesterase [Aquincola tertiaricarbonis]|uniref:metallophosphoesterase n=1 Tax=Aquincola tertiaricarbonis TaxID=391953 RepID=UPI000614C8AB|nr:metallophosphoesterase [Aquincola tertiaricarbonis]
MRLQLLSDLHLESEEFDPQPAPGADLLVLAGDLDSRWQALERFAHWPVPVLCVAGNHEFDRRELTEALPALRERCAGLGITLLERDATVRTDAQGRRVRFLGTVRWCDFDLFGPSRRAAAQRAGNYFQRVMQATKGGQPFDAAAVREEALACRAWLADALAEPADGRWEATVVVTHFAPSLSSADPRYGSQNGTASFCNADDDLITQAELWLHGHLHCRHDYTVPRPGGGLSRVVCQARGLAAKNEPEGFDPLKLIEVFG